MKIVYPILEKTQCTIAGVFSTSLYQLSENAEQNKKYTKKVSNAQKILDVVRKGKYFRIDKVDYFRFINPSPMCTALNREWAIKLGGYDCLNPKPGIIDGKFHFSLIYHGKGIMIPQSLAYKRILENGTLNSETTKNILIGVYTWGRILKKEYGKQQLWNGFLLDISTVYMALGMKKKYNFPYDIKKLLVEMGVQKWMVKMPSKVIHLIKYMTLIDLIFRK